MSPQAFLRPSHLERLRRFRDRDVPLRRSVTWAISVRRPHQEPNLSNVLFWPIEIRPAAVYCLSVHGRTEACDRPPVRLGQRHACRGRASGHLFAASDGRNDPCAPGAG